MDLTEAKKCWHRFAESKRGRHAIKAVRLLLTGGVVAYLGLHLWDIGLAEVWASRPRTPWFYLILLGMYFTLPLFETVIFGIIWNRTWRESLPALFKKRVYNREVLGYSGEVYLYLWARERVDLPSRQILHTIKDNVIVSSLASTVVAVVLLLLFSVTGQIVLPEAVGRYSVIVAASILLVGGGLVAAGRSKMRQLILSLPGRVLLALFVLHLVRILTAQTLQVAQWAVVMPEEPFSVWFTMLAVQIIVSRIPLPNREFLFVGVGLELSSVLDVSSSSIASMLLMTTFLDKMLNIVLFTSASVLDRKTSLPSHKEAHELDLAPVTETTVEV